MKFLTVVLAFVLAATSSAFTSTFAGSNLVRPAVQSGSSISMYVKINVGEGEPVDSAVQRFRREVNRAGHMRVLRNRRYFENSQQKAIRKEEQARQRARMMRSRMRSAGVIVASTTPNSAQSVDKYLQQHRCGRIINDL
uniref:30S ribosomal protein S21 n=1 Tax=Fibrocapsa japonica TaxID=94617 RepID=A0A7S2Y4B7_9STRA|mmetsp:Transcript_7567/g.11499  ORF Transcript_7567/g.11499 Transcript_7567/m.11499 type:complete len:139 (+) Transcript_7567:126-542(+)|eukprot:CAMPEP_0113942740 /NCGR_PEP_ID=MMETSP1339-20121228/8876_1 /TAXON_ID=94617 /ORGANISM="Fibrocapsa japonica" /LENGTH=138 /DNA_ID=CAMNT_0000947311 /DNA_START=123 /DNA_END=539 /DNA_ORIENTATION=+ /assembly_acc=CAM_ASM_000762